MAESTQNTYNKADELDLISLAEKLIYFFKSFGKLIILFCIGGIIAGGLIYLVSPKQYSSRLILHSVILTNQEEIEIVETWKDLLKKKEYGALAKTMNCDAGLFRGLNRISAGEIQKLYVQNNPNGFIVAVVVKDTGILDELQRGIVYGLEESEYVTERVALKRSNLNEMIKKVKIEIAKLDSTKTNVENIINNKNKSSSSLLIDISGINAQLIGLNEKLFDYQEQLKFVNAVQVLQGFSKLSKPDTPRLSKSLFFGLIAGGFIGYLVAMTKYIRRQIKIRSKARLQTK